MCHRESCGRFPRQSESPDRSFIDDADLIPVSARCSASLWEHVGLSARRPARMCAGPLVGFLDSCGKICARGVLLGTFVVRTRSAVGMRPVLYAAGAFGGAAAAAMGAAVGYGTMLGTVPRECPHCAGEGGTRAVSKASFSSGGRTVGSTAVEEALRRKAYDDLAPTFDEELEWHEFFTGIKLMRWWMMRQARGNVLEVAAG